MLEGIRGLDDLRALPARDLDALCARIREDLVESVARTGGHLGPNLGVVELTVALHRVFDSPRDYVLWDTGHQTYVHKMLTGRRDFSRLRKKGGLSGYPSRAESPHDLIENSHASTALGYADGIAKVLDLAGRQDRKVVAVIGDGALTGGMAWEAMNNIGGAARPVVVVLNDNGRSYDPTVGGLAGCLARLRAGGRTGGTTLFEEIGLAYLGPVDGHDVPAVETALREARDLGRPVVVHCVTRKGQGYGPALDDERDHFHGIGPIDPGTGAAVAAAAPSWTSVFEQEVLRLVERRGDVVAVTAAMAGPVGLGALRREHPHRVFDVGIAEQHAVASAVGMALAGAHPVVAVYATFLNRAFDQVLMDAALHRAGITFVLDRAGVTGDDGASHNGVWDMSVLQVVPGIRVAAPRDATRLRELLGEAAAVDDGPTVVRFPKGAVGADIPSACRVGGVDLLREPADGRGDVLIVACGALAGAGVEAADRLAAHGVGATVVDPRWVLPVPPAIGVLAAGHRLVVTLEDNLRAGGVGAAVAQHLRDAGVDVPVRDLGLPRRFLDHSTRDELLAEFGLTSDAVVEAALRHFALPTGIRTGRDRGIRGTTRSTRA